MTYETYTPLEGLKKFVKCFWMITEGDVGQKERILPNGTAELLINLCDNEILTYAPNEPHGVKRFSGVVVAGAYSRALVCNAKQHRSMLGVHFRPGGAFYLLGPAASDLTDAHANLEDFWGPSAANLIREQVCEAASAGERFQIVEQALLARACRVRSHHPAVEAALRLFGPSGSGASTRHVAHELGISQRRFIQVFTREIGLLPKLFCRILRFKYARILTEQESRKRSGLAVQWVQIANASGYYDQSHFIRDFRDFSGLSPSEYVEQFRPIRGRSHERENRFQLSVGRIPELLAVRDLQENHMRSWGRSILSNTGNGLGLQDEE